MFPHMSRSAVIDPPQSCSSNGSWMYVEAGDVVRGGDDEALPHLYSHRSGGTIQLGQPEVVDIADNLSQMTLAPTSPLPAVEEQDARPCYCLDDPGTTDEPWPGWATVNVGGDMEVIYVPQGTKMWGVWKGHKYYKICGGAGNEWHDEGPVGPVWKPKKDTEDAPWPKRTKLELIPVAVLIPSASRYSQ